MFLLVIFNKTHIELFLSTYYINDTNLHCYYDIIHSKFKY